MLTDAIDPAFPCALTLHIPFPTPRLASTALHALEVDQELSPLVRRSFSLGAPANTVLQVAYSAATNRMLRVAVNGFFESLVVVLGVMEELDVDVYQRAGKEPLAGAQGVVAVGEER